MYTICYLSISLCPPNGLSHGPFIHSQIPLHSQMQHSYSLLNRHYHHIRFGFDWLRLVVFFSLSPLSLSRCIVVAVVILCGYSSLAFGYVQCLYCVRACCKRKRKEKDLRINRMSISMVCLIRCYGMSIQFIPISVRCSFYLFDFMFFCCCLLSRVRMKCVINCCV